MFILFLQVYHIYGKLSKKKKKCPIANVSCDAFITKKYFGLLNATLFFTCLTSTYCLSGTVSCLIFLILYNSN